MSEGKTCTRCGEALPFEAFVVDRRTSTGRGARCRGCESERQRRYHAEHGDAFNARRRERYAALPPGKRYDPLCYQRNRERVLARARARYGREKAAVETRRELCAEAFDAHARGRRIQDLLMVWRGRIDWLSQTGARSVRAGFEDYTRADCQRIIAVLERGRAEAIREMEKQTRLKGSKQDVRRKAA